MEDREHGETDRESSDYLQRKLDQTMENTHICSQCGKRLSSHWELQIHEWVHTEKKLFRRPECEKSVYTKGKLVSPQEVTHNLQSPLSFPEAEVQLVSEQGSHPVEGTEQNHLTAPSTGKSREVISQQLENEEIRGPRQERETLIEPNPMRKDALLPNQVLSETTPQGREASGSQLEPETVTKLNPTRKVALLAHQVLSADTSYVGEMSDRECGGTYDHLQRQLDQTMENTHICSNCGKGLSSYWDLQIHERIHTGEKPYRCPEYEKSFYTEGKLVAHQEVTHSLQFPLLFPEAGQETVTKLNPTRIEALLAHQILSAVISYVGKMSDRQHGGTHWQSLDLLQRQPVQKTNKTYTPLVDQVLSESTSLVDQSLSTATSAWREVVERGCEENVMQSTDCLQGNSAETKKKTYTCPQCGKSLSFSSSCSCHMQTHSCSVCKKSFSSKSELSEHKQLHKKKKHQCGECGKNFATRSRLLRHERIHTGEKPYTCIDCGKHFRTNSNLSAHQKCHKDERPHQCVDCEKSFKFKGNLYAHRRIHTGEKPYKCLECEKSFSYNASLVLHIRSHTGEKPYKCPNCAKCFSCKSKVSEHIKSHTRAHT